ncbi:uncharacterized protein ACIBXB_003545 [Morphnus guianensis]
MPGRSAAFPLTPALLVPAQDPALALHARDRGAGKPSCRASRLWKSSSISAGKTQPPPPTPPSRGEATREGPAGCSRRSRWFWDSLRVVLSVYVPGRGFINSPCHLLGLIWGQGNKCGDAGQPPPSLSQPPQPTPQSLCDSRTSGVGDAGNLPEHPAQPPALLLLLLPGLPWHGSCCRRRWQGWKQMKEGPFPSRTRHFCSEGMLNFSNPLFSPLFPVAVSPAEEISALSPFPVRAGESGSGPGNPSHLLVSP